MHRTLIALATAASAFAASPALADTALFAGGCFLER